MLLLTNTYLFLQAWNILQMSKVKNWHHCRKFLTLAAKILGKNTSEDKCTALLSSVVFHAWWTNISCTGYHFDVLVCVFENNTPSRQPLSVQPSTVSCSSTNIKLSTTCINLEWISNFNSTSRIMKKESSSILENVLLLDILASTTTYLNPIILFHDLIYELNVIHNIYEKTVSRSCGFYLSVALKLKPIVGRNVFKCEKDIYFSLRKLCNKSLDCDNAENNQICKCKKPGKNNHCPSKTFINQRSKCVTNLSLIVECFSLPFPHKSLIANHLTLQNDLVVDELDSAADEPMLKALLENNTIIECKNKSQIPCESGHPKCYNVFELCVYKLNQHSHLLYCRNGAHLSRCKLFVCNSMFKCPHFYCIPWEYVCDRKMDCPDGEDEGDECTTYTCENMYKCLNEKSICIVLETICNGILNCPMGDDEEFCELQEVVCPPNCQCFLFSIFCNNSELENAQNFTKFHSIGLVKSKIEMTIMSKLSQLLYFSFEDYNISMSCSLLPRESSTLRNIVIRFGKFQTVNSFCNKKSSHLLNIDFSHNGIGFLENKAFAGLNFLLVLNLSNNLLTKFPVDTLTNSTTIRVLSLLENTLSQIEADAFVSLALNELQSADFHICCLVPKVTKCFATRPWYISCSQLLPSSGFMSAFIAISMTNIILSVIAVLSILKTKSEKNLANITVTVVVSCTETLCGVYLTCLWGADASFGNNYIIQEEYWRSSIFCHFASFLLLLFNILEPSMIFFLSISRFMIVKHPLDSNFKDSCYVSQKVVAIVLAVLVVTTAISTTGSCIYPTLPTNLCLPFVDPTNSVVFVKVLTILVATSQLGICIFIPFIYFSLVRKKQASAKKVETSISDKNSDTPLIIQLLVVTLSNIVCWVPTNTIFIISLFLKHFPSKLVICTTVFVVPINSIVNPSVFIFTSLRTICRELKN